MLGSKWNRWLLVSGLAVGALAACGEEDDGSDGTGTQLTPADASTPVDATTSTLMDASQCFMTPLGTGVICTTSSGSTGYQLCQNGVPTGTCMGLGIPEAGLPEATIGQFLPEGGLGGLFEGGLPDGALSNLPACPSGFECSKSSIAYSFLSGVLMGAGFCSAKGDAIGLPPSCTTNDECTTKGFMGSCVNTMAIGSFCVQPCSPQ